MAGDRIGRSPCGRRSVLGSLSSEDRRATPVVRGPAASGAARKRARSACRAIEIALLVVGCLLSRVEAFDITPPSPSISAARTFDVKSQFGATGGGTQDDSAALQNALDAANKAGGGQVFVPCGAYLIQTRLIIYSNTRLYGSGWCTIIRVGPKIDTARGQAVKTPTGAGGTRSVVIEDLQIDGNKANVPLHGDPNEQFQCGIELDEVTDGIVRNVFVHDTVENGIIVDNSSTRIRVEGNLIVNPGKVGASGGRGINSNISVTDLRIANNTVVGAIGAGIVLQAEGGNHAERWLIEGNTVSGSGQTGIAVGDNEISAITRVDIHVRRGAIVGNTIVSSTGHGIRLFEYTRTNRFGRIGIMESITVSRNTVTANGGHGISIEKGNDGSVCCIVVSGNIINDNVLSGVATTTGTSDTVIAGNVILRNRGGPFSNGGARNVLGGNTTN